VAGAYSTFLYFLAWLMLTWPPFLISMARGSITYFSKPPAQAFSLGILKRGHVSRGAFSIISYVCFSLCSSICLFLGMLVALGVISVLSGEQAACIRAKHRQGAARHWRVRLCLADMTLFIITRMDG